MTHEADKHSKKPKVGRLGLKPGIAAAAGAVLVIGALLAVMFVLPKGERINKDGYQVVYMLDGKAFFGQLQNTSGDYLVIKVPYTAQNVTPASQESEAPKDQQQSTTLLKVSQQAYGPEDVISLRSDQVSFWQNLREDSKVSQAIKNAK